MERKGDNIFTQVVNFITDAAATAGSGVAEQPVMTGISRLASGDKYGNEGGIVGGISSSIAGAPSSFVPTLFSQIAATIDTKRRQIPRDFAGRMVALFANKIPGLSMALSERKSVLGEDIKKGTGNVITDVIFNLVSPTIYSKLKDNPNVNLISQLYAETKDTDVLPRKSAKTLTYKGQVFELDQEQQSQLQQKTAELVLERMSSLTNLTGFDKFSMERRAAIIKKVYDYAGYIARKDMLKIMKRKEIDRLLTPTE
jgi:hypothetical protein